MAKADETDLEWEYNVSTAGPNAITPWQSVTFEEPKPLRCWASEYWESGQEHGCFNDSTTSIGLCDEHYEALIPRNFRAVEEAT